ncbi:PQQ-dependent sugar dehydrogenase [Natronospirillum operosum]|nr:PQQ-dependent sugar dehydrogenase [Natronospirillum operosum]
MSKFRFSRPDRRSPLPCCLALVLTGLAAVAAAADRTPPVANPSAEQIERTLIWDGLPGVVDGSYLPGSAQQLLVVQQSGRLYWLHEGSGRAQRMHEFAVSGRGDLGVQAMAIHPDYPADPRLFVLLNPADGPLRTRLEMWQMRTDIPGRPRLETRETLLSVPQAEPWHSGRGLTFGPEGYLYAALGDGGHRAGAQRLAQSVESLRGKILRLDVSRREPGRPYAIPADNPDLNDPAARPEIWALGVRHPGRLSFDADDSLWLVDAYGDHREEVHQVAGGDNLGWRCYQGRQRHLDDAGCADIEHRPPVFDYRLRGDQRVVGGGFYSARLLPGLQDHYLFADFHAGTVWALGAASEPVTLGRWDWHPSALIPRPEGDFLIADYVSGRLYQLSSAPQ